MAPAVIDRLEAVQIEIEQRRLHPMTAAIGQVARQHRHEAAPVQHGRQHVMVGQGLGPLGPRRQGRRLGAQARDLGVQIGLCGRSCRLGGQVVQVRLRRRISSRLKAPRRGELYRSRLRAQRGCCNGPLSAWGAFAHDRLHAARFNDPGRHHHGQPVRLADDEAGRRTPGPAGRRLGGQGRQRAPHAPAPLRFRHDGQGQGLQGHHRRRRRRGPPAGHGRLHDRPAGAGRAGPVQGAEGPR
ncbi:hypothetical protein D3C77_440020 [compost metagenome]